MGLLKLKEETTKKLVIKQQYDEKAGFWDIFSYRGTAVEMVTQSASFWILVGLHVLLWVTRFYHCQLHEGWDASPPVPHPDQDKCGPNMALRDILRSHWKLSLGDISPLSGLTTFLVVFYNGNCFSRYNSMYGECIAIQGKLHNMSLYLRTYYTSPSTRWNVIRYPLASHFIFYWSMQQRYFLWKKSQFADKDPGTFEELVNNTLIAKGVLIPKEGEALTNYPANKHKLLFTWSIIALKRIMQAPLESGGEGGNPMLNDPTEQTALITSLKEEIIGMRGAIGKIDNSMLFPIPFQYFHVVNVVLKLDLLLLAYAFLFIDIDANPNGSPWSLIAYPLICFVLLGLIEVANAMADPFGSDACDFNQHAILNGVYDDCKKLCELPDEDFLQEIGDPKFNPARNADGSLAEANPLDEPVHEDQDESKEAMWADTDVAALVREKEDVEAALRVHDLTKLEGTIGDLAAAMKGMIRMQEQTSNMHVNLVDGIEELKSDVSRQNTEVTRLEDLTGKQMDRVNRLERLQAHRLATVSPQVQRVPPLQQQQVTPTSPPPPPPPLKEEPKTELPIFGLTMETKMVGGSAICVVADVMHGSPAQIGTLRHGDHIVTVDAASANALTAEQVTPKKVKDLIRSKGWNDAIVFAIVRLDGSREVLKIWRGGLSDSDGNPRYPPTPPPHSPPSEAGGLRDSAQGSYLTFDVETSSSHGQLRGNATADWSRVRTAMTGRSVLAAMTPRNPSLQGTIRDVSPTAGTRTHPFAGPAGSDIVVVSKIPRK
eukprot:CAMPEP_0173099218 /NCGR_PEP_ID=MMETSP1102-20130122/35347_1 /TAXON_ID=49646 /ORGANISM="Geminigera sp., Strain Caron Lab Isolate" /LENGTH=770 /DNA_ID=CAMNT_0013992167 /DNA_START=70 /DNA_END=2382 /DNA_ORIENTATION=-